MTEAKTWLDQQSPGTTLHYHDCFNQWVRGVVTLDHKFRPLALVGAWSEPVLRYSLGGELTGEHHAMNILNGVVFCPDDRNFLENPECTAGCAFWEALLDEERYPLDLAPPDLTPRQVQLMKRSATIEAKMDELRERHERLAAEFYEWDTE